MKLLELFAGSRSIGKEAESFGFQVFSVDWKQYENINLCIDIGNLKKEDIPFIPDIVWASPDCSTYSISACGKHRIKTTIPKSEFAIKCDIVNRHWIKLIKEWLEDNPRLVFFIENPRGMLRHMDFMQEFKRYTIWYCQYGDSRAKPTDIWTNSKIWIPRPVCRNYKYDKEGNIINRHCHHDSARRGSNMGSRRLKGSYQRGKIPSMLCKEILQASIK